MEIQRTQTVTYQPESFKFADNAADDPDVQTRLNALLALNRETAREKELFRSERERFEAGLVKNPLTAEKAFAQFGLMLGAFPPMAIFGRFIANTSNRSEDSWIILLLIFVNFVCAISGYFSGKLIGKMVAETEKWNWAMMILIAPFIGILWGIMAGGAGGIFIFVIGAIFGAMIASAVGGLALPIFTIFHRWLKKGDVIEQNQFLPIALGITFTICAFILGLNVS